MTDRPTFDWPPLDTAVQRASDRRDAMLEGMGAGDRDYAHISDDRADVMLRAWFNGTDIDVDSFGELGEMLMSAVAYGILEGIPVGDAISSAIRDAFTIGFWTREAMALCICRTREIGCPCPLHGYSDEGLR